MTKVIFYCDESGAKGYADQDEAYPGEVGVFAGIMVPAELLNEVRIVFDQIAVRYAPESGKLHIADLSQTQQESMRKELFSAMRDTKLPCFWYAIHVAGLHCHHQFGVENRRKLDEAMLSECGPSAPRIKRGSPRNEPESMHVELFIGLYSHLIAFLSEHKRTGVDIEVRTDQVDTPIVKRFSEVAIELLQNNPTVTRFTGFDTVEKKIVASTVTVETHLPPELDMSPVVQSLSIVDVSDTDGLLLAADVLANSLNHLFKNREDNALYSPLNCREAIVAHPLAAHLDAFVNWGSGDLFGDRLYRHPKASL